MKHPKFEQKLRDNVIKDVMRQDQSPCYGLVLSYDAEKHQATVVATQPGSEQVGEIFKDVPCPQTPGVQTRAPEQGRPCWLGFPNGTKRAPVIISFFNPSHIVNDYEKQARASTDIPSFLTEI